MCSEQKCNYLSAESGVSSELVYIIITNKVNLSINNVILEKIDVLLRNFSQKIYIFSEILHL